LPARPRDPRDDPAQRADLGRRLRDRAPLAAAGAARGPAPPPAPRLHDGRPVAAEPRTSAFDGGGAGRVPPITPQLALRVAVLGVIAFALFGIVFFRLWYLQVLSGHQYLRQGRANSLRELTVPAEAGVA